MKTLLVILLLISAHSLFAQLCPGGGLNFNNAVTFDPAWIYGCNTGTSCNGGINLDNRVSCQPTTAMDACAPSPSCGNVSQNASNIWFKFFPTGSNVILSCFQNTSLVLAIQAFSGGPACGSLTEIGCAISTGPSSGVSLPLTGLLPGHLYYFRIFGSANPVSQRTGLYCFCGTTGLTNFILPVVLTDFSGTMRDNNAQLSWSTSTENNSLFFDIEKSSNGESYHSVGRMAASGTSFISHHYTYTDALTIPGTNYYRLKLINADGIYDYSNVISVSAGKITDLILSFNNTQKELQITVSKKDILTIYSVSGQQLQRNIVTAGNNLVSVSALPNGVYLLYSKEYNTVKRFCVFN